MLEEVIAILPRITAICSPLTHAEVLVNAVRSICGMARINRFSILNQRFELVFWPCHLAGF